MDYYKFGNTLCKLREEHQLTQKELAAILDVSDKAVSKWENGQAIPRMETLEKIAATLNTSVEELITISKDNSKRICIKNSYADIAHIELDGELYSIKEGDSKWIELNPSLNEHTITINGELTLDYDWSSEDAENLKEKLINKGAEKFFGYIGKVINNCVLQTECTYQLENVENETELEIELDTFSIGDKAMINENFLISYPKLNTEHSRITLLTAKSRNTKDFLRHKRKMALTSDLAIDIPLMLLVFPVRMAYFKSLCKPEKLKANIEKADDYNDKYNKEEEKQKKRKHPVLKTILLFIILIIGWFTIDFVGDVLNVETEKPALISSDYSTIELFRDTYVRIDEMPFDAIPAKDFGIETWYDARLDGLSKLDQSLSEDKVTIFEDSSGKKYLWLVCDYPDSTVDENGETLEFEDFEDPMVYEIKE